MGMIQMFKVIEAAQLPSPGQLAGGVWEALLTTAAGLVRGGAGVRRIQLPRQSRPDLVLDMEKAATRSSTF